MNWLQLILTLLGSGVGTAIVSLIFKQKYDRQLEQQKSYLARGTRLHERTVDTLIRLYSALYKAQAYLQIMSGSAVYEGVTTNDYSKLLVEAIVLARDELLVGRLLIPVELVERCDHLFKTLLDGRASLDYATDPMVIDGNQRKRLFDAASGVAYKEVPALLAELEATARAIIHS